MADSPPPPPPLPPAGRETGDDNGRSEDQPSNVPERVETDRHEEREDSDALDAQDAAANGDQGQEGSLIEASSSPPSTLNPPTASAEVEGHTTAGAASTTSGSTSSDPLPSSTPASSDPLGGVDTNVRTGLSGFSALVDAFMNGFRQSAAAAAAAAQNSSSATSNPAPPTSNLTPAPAEQLERQQTNGVESLRNGAHPAGSADEARTSGDNASEARQPSAENGTNATDTASDDANRPRDNESDSPRTLFFRMPFVGQSGRGAVLAFHPGPIPVPQAQRTANEGQPERPSRPERGNGQASGFHLPVAPIFVPLGASPLPFSFLFDTQVNTAWPIANISYGPPGAMPPENPDPDLPQFVAGPPFHIALNISFGPPPEPERPDPERASRFVASLERADAELRMRMARLGMGSIGDYGDHGQGEGGFKAALGCGICLDEYSEEDRPEWIGGKSAVDEEVVVVSCAGHHTLHRVCLYEWLAQKPPSEWTCPFCRAPLDKEKVDRSASDASSQPPQTARRPSTGGDDDDLKNVKPQATARTMREEIRLRERACAWRCDAPACLPRYPDEDDDKNATAEASSLVSLLPCRHQIHVDCLCMSMRLEQTELGSSCSDDDDDDDDDETNEQQEGGGVIADEAISEKDHVGTDGSRAGQSLLDEKENKIQAGDTVKTVGKWVTCPLCRHEAWAELPVRRKPKRADTKTDAHMIPEAKVQDVSVAE